PQGLFEALLGGESKANVPSRASSGGGGGSGTTTINGINVNLDAALLEDLNRPRLMYLWRGQ
ncbi:MAG: hypothetical protein JWN40_1072, partial [Phycisphaerales bacterium]|nr:hypothetical protein [Phycisphaerales bacterium]